MCVCADRQISMRAHLEKERRQLFCAGIVRKVAALFLQGASRSSLEPVAKVLQMEPVTDAVEKDIASAVLRSKHRPDKERFEQKQRKTCHSCLSWFKTVLVPPL